MITNRLISLGPKIKLICLNYMRTLKTDTRPVVITESLSALIAMRAQTVIAINHGCWLIAGSLGDQCTLAIAVNNCLFHSKSKSLISFDFKSVSFLCFSADRWDQVNSPLNTEICDTAN